MNRLNWLFSGATAGILVFGGLAFQASAQREGKQNQTPMMQPMMQAMNSVSLHAGSPDVLVARAEQRKLSEQQKEKLRAISQRARNQARKVLNDAQQEQLEADESDYLTPMDLVKLVGKESNQGTESGEKKMMCPMCQKMMEKKMAK